MTPTRKVDSRHTAAAQRETGFPEAVRRAVRARAGFGDPDQARCECHGIWLGRRGGEMQHRVARGMGGRGAAAPPWINDVVNAALMCRPGHRQAEARDERMHEAGFWLEAGQDPALVPIRLHGVAPTGPLRGGDTWLTPAGSYSITSPGGAS